MNVETRVEYEIRHEHAEDDARIAAENCAKAEAYQRAKEEYRAKYSPPAFIDAEAAEGPRPEVYPVILAQLGGLVHVLRWAPWAGAYAVSSTHRERYVTVDSVRFWLPMPEPVDMPEGLYS